MYCYTQTVAIMADDDQKVKRQDADVASSSLSTSSARMYGKYSLKVFWAIGLFFLLSSMETTPAEAVGYPEEMKREIDERRKANNFTNLKNIEIYGNATDETVPVLWYLDELETVVKNILAGNVLVYRKGFGNDAVGQNKWLQDVKERLCKHSEKVDGVVPKPENIKTISFEVTEDHPMCSPHVNFIVKFADNAGRHYTVKSARLQARWAKVAAEARIRWHIGNFVSDFLEYTREDKADVMLKRFLSYALKPQPWTEMYMVPFANVGIVTYGVYFNNEGKRKIAGLCLYTNRHESDKTDTCFVGYEITEGELTANDKTADKIPDLLKQIAGYSVQLKNADKSVEDVRKQLGRKPMTISLKP
eukprot:GHVS01073012.1.p1 GENE.GHVS01073012.1~~GHVS01073012.1.p1  ORF type:complete len:361 (+),score=24.21 GHVS01073012.1:135-1217(+)